MNPIVFLALVLTIVYSFFLALFLTPKAHKKKIKHGKFDLFQFMLLFFAPMIVIPALYFLKRIIISSAKLEVFSFPIIWFDLFFFLLIYFLILGNGIHSVSVINQKHMKDLRKHNLWKINEFFHNSFSHFLITIPAMLILFLYSLLEINHPVSAITSMEIWIILLCGILLGIGTGIACTEGSIPKVMFYVIFSLSIIIPLIFVSKNLDFRNYPFSTLTETLYISAVITLSFYKYKLKGFPEMVPHYFFDDK